MRYEPQRLMIMIMPGFALLTASLRYCVETYPFNFANAAAIAPPIGA